MGRGITNAVFRIINDSNKRISNRQNLICAGEQHCIEQIAADLGITRQFLTRLFKQQTGVSPKSFEKVMRVWRAAKAMEAGHNAGSWSQVAHDFGFYDESHFKESFADCIGLTPGQYRQTLKEPRTPVEPA
jgi:AraC-like DNA-binding protein